MFCGKQPAVSVVILTKNSSSTVKKTLESVFNQEHNPDEVIVVDGRSTDNTLSIVKSYPVKIVIEPGLGFGHARNLGVKEAKGDVIFFIDSDCYAEPQWIERALHHFKNPEIAGVTGPTRLWNVNDGVARFIAYVGGRMNMPTKEQMVKIAPTMNLALRRQIILEVGGFDPNLVRGEDTELTYKITKHNKIIYEPKAVVWFRGSPNLKIASRKCFHHFIGVGQLFAECGFNLAFVRFNLLLRGIILICAIVSLALAPWYIPAILFLILLAEFMGKTLKAYIRYRDKCVIYYTFFFTLWSLTSFAVIFGFIKQKTLKKRTKTRKQFQIFKLQNDVS